MAPEKITKGLPGLPRVLKAKGKLQKELAEALGVSVKHLSEISNGKCNASYSLLLRMSSELKVSIAQLTGEEALADA